MTLGDAAVAHLRATLDLPDAGDRYEVLERLGRGGMGTVYRARDRVLERDVALKVLSTDADSDALAARLAREARVLARLEHPGIVAVHDAATLADGRPYYVMRLVRGASLDAWARERGLGDVLRVFLRVCDAVAFAHARGVIHRDLKPSNIMVGEFGEVLVLDWGVAKVTGVPDPAIATSADRAAQPDATAEGAVVGTPGFMAPEQATGGARHADARADVYGLGAILSALLGARGGATPRPLAAVAARAMAAEPSARYADAEGLAADLRRWLDGEPVGAYRESLLERAGRFYRRNQTLILLLAAYVVMRAAIFVWRGL